MTLQINRATSENNPYPGIYLEEKLLSLGMSQIELSKRTGITTKTINSIVKGTAPISPETAMSFSIVLGESAEYWLELEAKYQLTKVNAIKEETLKSEVSFLKKINYNEMVKAGWLRKETIDINKLKRLYEFFGVSSKEQLYPVWSQLEVNYRTSTVYKKKHYNIMAWLRRGELLARDISCKPYTVANFKKALHECRKLTTLPFGDCCTKIQKLCSNAGVAVVFVRELPGVATSGAAHWIDKEKALIQLSLRGKVDDKFWFNFFHEAGHILLHGRKEQFIDNNAKGFSIKMDEDANTPYLTEENKLKEAEADEFSGNFLIPKRSFSKFVSIRQFDEISVKAFAKSEGISPGIVVGQLQNKGYIGWSRLTNLKQRYDFPDGFDC